MVAVFAACLLSPAIAFEESGHNMVAQLMVPLLNDGTKAEMQRLFGATWQRDVVERASMIQTELSRPKNQPLAALQVTLFEIGATEFDAAKHCPKNACSVAAILESRQVLLKNTYVDADKRQALFYLMHYMVQLHIPINAGLVRDQGGQNIYLKDDALLPVNFAWIWNHDIYRLQGKRWFTYAQELSRVLEKANKSEWTTTLSVPDWAWESHQIALNQVYPLAAEGRYSANVKKAGKDIIETQLMKAAYRTAMLLNAMFPDPVVDEKAKAEVKRVGG